MNDEQQPCTREDLGGYVPQSVVVTLREDGTGEDVIDHCDLDLDAVDEFYCSNCTAFWTVNDKYDAISRAQAWQAALDHLKVKEAV